MIVQRRNYYIVRQLEEKLAMYRRSLNLRHLTPILDQLKEKGHNYDPNMIDDLLNMHQGIHGAALELYDILNPIPEEEGQSSRERRLYIIQMGII